MTLKLTPEMLRACYDFLCITPPFNKWNLPDSDDVTFTVAKDRQHYGWHTFDGVKHAIFISQALVGQTGTLIETMAHEVIHLHEHHSQAAKRGVEHSAAFRRWSAGVCRHHGFDPHDFV